MALRALQRPQLASGEILVRVLGCTICASDLHTYSGRRQSPSPSILGHEAVGEIIEIAGDTPRVDYAKASLVVGDRVTWGIVAHCGQCWTCRRGLTQKCLNGIKYGHHAFAPGNELRGAFAEACVLAPGTTVVKLPSELPLETACPASCATATASAAMEAAGALFARDVAIFGAGMLGLTLAAMCKQKQAASVTMIEPHPFRRGLAEQFGADRILTPEEFVAMSGPGLDAAFEASGNSENVSHTLHQLKPGGTLVLLGAVFPSGETKILPERMVRQCLTLRGVHNYGPQHLLQAVNFLTSSHLQHPFGNLVHGWRPLDKIDEAFQEAMRPEVIRMGISLIDSAKI